MAMRLQEIHPSLVHYPITLLPLAIGADALGRATGNEALLEAGRWAMMLAAGSAAVAAVFGLVAQQEVNAEGEALDTLITHRNLNLVAVGAATGLAARRWSQKKPSAGYLALGLASIGLVAVSAYLGGHMVYELGVGVKPAGGLKPTGVPELTTDDLASAARTAGHDIVEGARVTAREIGEGKLAPSLAPHGDTGQGA